MTTPPLTDERLAEYVALGPPTRQDGAEIARELADLLRQLREAGEDNGGKYCNRYMDDAPSIRADCEDHRARGMQCITCPNRNLHDEVKDLRSKLRALRGLVRT